LFSKQVKLNQRRVKICWKTINTVLEGFSYHIIPAQLALQIILQKALISQRQFNNESGSFTDFTLKTNASIKRLHQPLHNSQT
jgi:hypothetical protein